MASTPGITAEDAFAQATSSGHGFVIGKSSSFICPYEDCKVLAQYQWGTVSPLIVQVAPQTQSGRQRKGEVLTLALCEACDREVIFLGKKIIWPIASEAPAPAADMPDVLRPDYAEAAKIYRDSPRGAAALLRLLIQKLCSELGSTHKDINAAIGGFVAEGRISPAIQRALDAVRVLVSVRKGVEAGQRLVIP